MAGDREISWETAFVAMSLALGEPEDEAAAFAAVHAPLRVTTADRDELLSSHRAARARRMALILGAVALDVERMGFSWR